MASLTDLPNIGPKLSQQLCAVGIDTKEALRHVGAQAAWLRIQAIDPSACLLRLMALEGAVQGVKKAMLPPERKAELQAFYHENKITGKRK